MSSLILAPVQTHLLFILTGFGVYLWLSLLTWFVEDVMWLRFPLVMPVVFYILGVLSLKIIGVV